MVLCLSRANRIRLNSKKPLFAQLCVCAKKLDDDAVHSEYSACYSWPATNIRFMVK